MKRGRKPFDPPCPQGYPYRLYKANDAYVVGLSKDEVRRTTNIKKIQLVKINELVSANGHSKTNVILKEKGNRWICKDGNIFFAA